MIQAWNKSLVNVIDKEEFTFRPYVYTPRGTSQLTLFVECIKEIPLSRRDSLDHLTIAMAAVVAPTLLSSKMEPDDGLGLYIP